MRRVRFVSALDRARDERSEALTHDVGVGRSHSLGASHIASSREVRPSKGRPRTFKPRSSAAATSSRRARSQARAVRMASSRSVRNAKRWSMKDSVVKSAGSLSCQRSSNNPTCGH